MWSDHALTEDSWAKNGPNIGGFWYLKLCRSGGGGFEELLSRSQLPSSDHGHEIILFIELVSKTPSGTSTDLVRGGLGFQPPWSEGNSSLCALRARLFLGQRPDGIGMIKLQSVLSHSLLSHSLPSLGC